MPTSAVSLSAHPPRPRRCYTALIAAVVAGAASTAAAVPADAAAADVLLRSTPTGQCLDVVGAAQAAGAEVQVYTCHGGGNQRWVATAAGELRTFAGTRCLDAFGAAAAAGTKLISWPCHGQANQRFGLTPSGTIVGAASGRCLEPAGNRRVVLRDCTGAPAQKWTQSPADGAPNAPTDLRASGVTCTGLTLTWKVAASGPARSTYDVYHDGQKVGSTSSTTLNVAAIAGVSWGWFVNARNASGVSQASPTVIVTPPQCSTDTTPPTAPTGLSAVVTGTSARLSWTASTDSSGVKDYLVQRDGGTVGTVTGATSLIDSGLAAGTTYRYTVLARDPQGNVSAPSTAATATTGASCATPICEVTTVATDTDLPWGLATLPGGDVLYTRRDAHDIVRLDPATGAKITVGRIDDASGTDGEGGLLGLAIRDDFATNPWVYLFYTTQTDNRIARVRLNGVQLDPASRQVLLGGIARNKFHNGGRLRFGPDGKLYASTGDAQDPRLAQDRTRLEGKILRINPDGTIPADNPFDNAVWSIGHRNPQGLAFDAQGRLWQQEFGNSAEDETNLVVKGANYGWPDCEGTVSQVAGACARSDYTAPKAVYPTSQASCSGLTVVASALFIACGRGERLYRWNISGDGLTGQTQHFVGTYGRLRTVEPAPGNALWLTTTTQNDKDSIPDNSNEKILRVQLG